MAAPLGSWAFDRLVNTTKGCGGYLAQPDGSTTPITHKRPLTRDRLVQHFRARHAGDLVGIHAIARDATGGFYSRWTAVDIDKHDDARGDAAANEALARAVHDQGKAAGFDPLLSQSDGRGGYHCLLLHAEPIEARLARALGRWLVRDWGSLGVADRPEVFPKQAVIRPDGWGSWLRLFGRHHKRPHFSRFWDGSAWLEGRDAIDFILGIIGSPADLIPRGVIDLLAREEAAPASAPAGRVALVEADLGAPDGESPAGGDEGPPRPGDDFAARHAWQDVLGPHGWSVFKVEGGVTYWARPGVTDHHGATTNHEQSDLLYVFTDATDFEGRQSYSKFGAFAVLEHGGDHAAAARYLAARGYGSGGRVTEVEAPATAGRGRPADLVPGGSVVVGSAATAGGEQPSPDRPDGAEGPVAMAAVVGPAPPARSDEEMGIVALRGVAPAPIEWLWPDRFARGKYNLLAGVGGEGKTQFATRLVAMVTRGEAFPDGSGTAPRGNCLFLSSEDGLRDTIIPRLMAAGADLELSLGITARRTVRADGKELVSWMSFQDLGYWREVFRRTRPILMVVDPIPAYLGRGVNDHHNNEVRAVLEPFCALLDEHGVTLLAITHLGKSVDQKTPIAKILGSVAYANLARTVSIIIRDPGDADRRLLCTLKNNFSAPQEALAYRIEGCTVEAGGQAIRTSRVVIEAETVDADAAELMAAQGRPRGPRPRRYLAMAEWLHDRLSSAPGPVAVSELGERAGDEGLLGSQDGAGRWSNFRLMYRGAAKVLDLPPPRDGRQVVQYVVEGGRPRKWLGLIPIGSVPPPIPGVPPGCVAIEAFAGDGSALPYPPPA